MAISKVGLGWPVGERQYTTLAAWVTALKASGSYEEAWCSGNLGTSFVTIASSDFLQGARIWGDVQYTGANHAAIAALPRSITVNSTANILIQDISCTNPNSTQPAMNLSGANVVAERCYAWQAVDPGSNAATLMVTNYATARNCVAVNTLSTASRVIRPSANGIVKNCIGVGGKYALFSEWTNSKTEKSYGVGASISSCFWGNGRPPGNVTNASEDSSGDVGFQNLNPTTNFVDYANSDYRIRNTSPLHAAGIGAFFEPASEPDYTVNINSTYPAYSVIGTVTNTKPEFSTAITSTYSNYGVVITADSIESEYTLTLDATYATYTASVSTTNYKPIDTVSITASYSSYIAAVNSTNTKPTKTTSIESTYPSYTVSVSATGGNVTYNSSINATYPLYTASVAVADVNKLSINTSYPAYTSNVISTNNKPIKTVNVVGTYAQYSANITVTKILVNKTASINVTYPVYSVSSVLTNVDPIRSASVNTTYSNYGAVCTLTNADPVNVLSINSTYPKYSASVNAGTLIQDRTLSINSNYPTYVAAVVIGDFVSLPYIGGKGAHLVISLGSRDVIIKDKSRNIKWRVENARL